MKVFVIGLNGLGLMPTTPRKARLLVKKGKATVVRKKPYTIRLLYKTGVATQPVTVGIDTGSQHIGVSVVTEKKVLSKTEYELRPSMEKKKLITARKEARGGRRYRKVRYRHPKFKTHTKRVYSKKPIKCKNGKAVHWSKVKKEYLSNRPTGWLPPSLQSKTDIHIQIIKKYMEALPPRTKLRIEAARFDMARMKDPSIHGDLYQKGRMYDYENKKAFLFARDGYKCAVCKKKGGAKRKDGSTVKLVAHHIDFRSKGATDNPDRMITVCTCCHSATAHKPGGILYQWMEDKKKFKRGLRDATFMNILVSRLKAAFPEAIFSYGNITKADRESMGLPKTHGNDAVAIACHQYLMNGIMPTDVRETVFVKQVRSNKRSLHEMNPRKGISEPNRTAKRNVKRVKTMTVNRKGKGKQFNLYDKVSYCGQTGWISGFTGTSAYVIDKDGEYIHPEGKNYKQIPLSQLYLLSHNYNWLTWTELQ